MKVVDKQLLFISSEERVRGYTSDFTLNFPSHLLTCKPNQHMRVILNDVVLPYTWYNIQESNRHFTCIERGSPVTIQLEPGSYNATQLRDHLQTVLNAATGSGYQYTVVFDEISAKFQFTIDSPTGVNAFQFESGTHHTSAFKLLGFEKGSTNTFAADSLTSSKTVSVMITDALLFHCDLMNTNVDKSTGDRSSFHISNVFGKLMINTSPFNNIIFQNQNDDYLINVPNKRITEMRFWFTTTEHEPIALNDEFSFTLKIEVLEDDEKTLVNQNSGIGELLKLLILQQHQGRNVQK